MNYKPIAKLACRIMAIYFFIISLQFVPNLFVNLLFYHDKMGDVGYSMLSSLSIILPGLVASILLWIFADKISPYMITEQGEEISARAIEYKNAAVLAFVIMGMFVLISSIASFVSTFIQYRMTAAQEFARGNINLGYVPRLIGDAVKMLLGLWLLFGSNGIVKVINFFRDFGKDSIEVPKE